MQDADRNKDRVEKNNMDADVDESTEPEPSPGTAGSATGRMETGPYPDFSMDLTTPLFPTDYELSQFDEFGSLDQMPPGTGSGIWRDENLAFNYDRDLWPC